MAYKSFSLEELSRTASKNTKVAIEETGDGALLFTQYGARLLGLYPKKSGANILWVFADLEESMRAGQWMSGGERLWIAPERAFFYENPRDFEGFHVPAGIDPGDYESNGDLSYINEFPALDYIKNETCEGCVARRSFALVKDPYDAGLAYAGVAISDSISMPVENIAMCAWSLAQIYTCGPEKSGAAFFPIKRGASLLSYFKPIPPERAEATNAGYARFKIDGDAIYKLAIRPEDMLFENPCKAVYVTPSPRGEDWLCCIKRTNDMPRSQAECVDVARDNPEGPMGAIQSYNNGPGFSGGDAIAFGEIELQLTKGALKGGATVSEAHHELLGYSGPKEAILELAQNALNASSKPMLF